MNILLKKITVCTFLALLPTYGFAEFNPEQEIKFPTNSALKFLEVKNESPANIDVYYYQGKIQLKGLLKAGWTRSGMTQDGLITHQLILNFYPELSEVSKLPNFKNHENSVLNTFETMDSRRIVFTNPDIENRAFVKKYFKSIPESFFKYSEGIIEQPAIVTLTNYQTYRDCESRDYRARLVDIEVIAQNDGSIATEMNGCDYNFFESNEGYADAYMTHAQDGFVNLREAPNTKSTILQKIQNDQYVYKIKTEGDWFYVSFDDEENKNNIKGYVHKSQIIGEGYDYILGAQDNK